MTKTIEELESAVANLSKVDQWDRQIEADIRAGHLDAAGKRAAEDFETGCCKLF